MTDILTVYIVCKDPDNFYEDYIKNNSSNSSYGLNDYVSNGDCVNFNGDNIFSEKGNHSCSNVSSSRALSNSKGVGSCNDNDYNKYVCLSISALSAPIFKSGDYVASPQSNLEWALTGEWEIISESADRYNMKCTYNAEMMNRQYISGYYNSQTDKFLLKTGISSTSTQLTNSPWSNLLSAFDFYVEVDTTMQSKYLLPISCWGPGNISNTCLYDCASISSTNTTEQQACLTNPKLNFQNKVSEFTADTFYGLPDDIRDMVACYAPQEATDSYNKQLGVEVSSENRMCVFSLCQNSNFYKTYSENIAPNTIKDCSDKNYICFQDIDVDNSGQISTDSINIATNCIKNAKDKEDKEDEKLNSVGFFTTKNIIILSSIGSVILIFIVILIIRALN